MRRDANTEDRGKYMIRKNRYGTRTGPIEYEVRSRAGAGGETKCILVIE